MGSFISLFNVVWYFPSSYPPFSYLTTPQYWLTMILIIGFWPCVLGLIILTLLLLTLATVLLIILIIILLVIAIVLATVIVLAALTITFVILFFPIVVAAVVIWVLGGLALVGSVVLLGMFRTVVHEIREKKARQVYPDPPDPLYGDLYRVKR